MRIAAFLAVAILLPGLLVAADHNVDFDPKIDFSKMKTFRIRNVRIGIQRPEINNPIVVANLTELVRVGLTSKMLKETSGEADVIVDITLNGVDYNVGPFGAARPIIDSGRGRRGGPAASTDPVDFTEADLVIDVSGAQPELLIWRGVSRTIERGNARLIQNLPSNAKKLLAEYPPKRRR
jgi:hypothetical protein